MGSGAARADQVSAVWVNPGFYSQHFDGDRPFRKDNVGIGVEVVVTPNHAVAMGTFINSDGARSRYGAYHWRPLDWKLRDFNTSVGIVLGAIDGYPRYRDGDWFIAPIPALTIEGSRLGVNLMVIPTIKDRVQGALAIQLKFRVW